MKIKTVAEELIEKFGKDNIFLVDADYHGLYHDDHCDFTYWNNVNGSMPTDHWTTAVACPAYGRYECMTLKEGVNQGLVDMNKLLDYLKATSKMKSLKYVNMINEPQKFYTIGLRIEAFKGRKWKGIGYLVGERKSSYTWGVQSTTTRYCKIYDPMTGRIEYINRNNCRLLDEEQLKQNYIAKYNEALKGCQVEDIVIGNHGPRLNVHIESFEDFVKHETIKPNTTGAFDEYEEEMKRKYVEFRTKKMTELIKWVKNNTDKETDQDIIDLAEHIFIKKYT